MKAAAARPSIAVIGAGFSGLLCAVHLLLRSPPDGPRIHLIEQSEAFGLGAAYATESGRHLLNTRASNMSVFPDRPGHFLQWLEAQPGTYGISGASFITRRTYGEYLQSLLRDAACGPHAAGRLYLVPDEVVALKREGKRFILSLKMGKTLPVDAVILATGNAPPHPPEIPSAGFFDSAHYVDDPWQPAAFDAIEPDHTILTLGTGLTMVDVVLLLKQRGHRGPVVAISRRGQVPRSHTAPEASPEVSVGPLPPCLSQAMARVRTAIREAEAQGAAWQHVMDTLRPINGAYWRSLPMEAKRRFLRHLRPWWDVHRHRLAPQVADRVGALIRDGNLVICRGRLVSAVLDAEPGSFPATVCWRPAASRHTYKIGVHAVVNCMGPGGDPTRSRSPLIQGLLASGLARPDALRLGFEVDEQCRLIDADGAVSERLFTLGPPTRGMFWESTAVPDIRQFAHGLADTALAAVVGDVG